MSPPNAAHWSPHSASEAPAGTEWGQPSPEGAARAPVGSARGGSAVLECHRRLTPHEKLDRHTDRSAGADGCWLWIGSRNHLGYGQLSYKRSGSREPVRVRAHRLSYELFRGPIPDGMFVCHRCDTPACVNPAHLFLGTNMDNVRDMLAKGRHFTKTKPEAIRRGAAINGSKLTEETVRDIRNLAGIGVPTKDLAATYGMSRASVRRVVTRESWSHVA